jgi:hypothetical protein
MNDIMRDAQLVTEFWLAVALVYVGCDLVSIRPLDHRTLEFKILCPALDFAEYQREFSSGRLAISDVRQLGKTHSLIGRLSKDARRDGEYINPDFVEMLQETG